MDHWYDILHGPFGILVRSFCKHQGLMLYVVYVQFQLIVTIYLRKMIMQSMSNIYIVKI